MFAEKYNDVAVWAVIVTVVFFFVAVGPPKTVTGQTTSIDFRRDIGPILADTCFKCHGPDESNRESGLRLDTRAGLLDEGAAVVPGDLDASEFYQRIISDDPDMIMPPLDSGRSLSKQQQELMRRWIEQGAPWQTHWSLIAPVSPDVPEIAGPQTTHSPIDHFIVARLNTLELSPAGEADRATLIRRVTMDLTGLPPSRQQLEKYAESGELDWYEQLVDELLASPKYGEHMARYWLDAARYGDTHGLHLDNYREMWPYRDWVVRAFNQNISYRQFTIDQLAGDLLEAPTDDQLIASGFNRAHVTTNEGGSIDEEVYVRNVVDRVSTTGTVFMGMTIGCAQCHDHKFDPVSQKEFYQLFAFFNNLTDKPLDQNSKDPAPFLMVMDDSQRLKLSDLEKQSKDAEVQFSNQLASFDYVDPVDTAAPDESGDANSDKDADDEPREFVWIEDDVIPGGATKEQQWTFVSVGEGPINSGEKSRVSISAGEIEQHFFTGAVPPLKAQKGDLLFAYVYLDPENPPEEVMLQYNDGEWGHRVYWGANKIGWGDSDTPSRLYAGPLPETGKWIRLEVDASKIGFEKLSTINGMAFTQFGGKAYWDSAGIVSRIEQAKEYESLSRWLEMVRSTKGAGLPQPIKKIVNQPADKLDPDATKQLQDYFLTQVHATARMVFSDPIKQRDEAKKRLGDYRKSMPTTLISKESETIKQAFLLKRGEYDQKGEPVERLTPAAMPPFSECYSRDRLGLAQWLTSEEHPLTARVAVNRFWQQLFGVGIVQTSEDFGTQGEIPSHPELLDWLTSEFKNQGWDVKGLMKEMVMSSTYRQSSVTSPQLNEIDPENRLLARGPRFRLDAEVLRDQALFISGMLVSDLGGPSVKPPQPDGLWFAVGYSGSNTVRFKQDTGTDKVHRRSLYTFWKRTASPPQMNTFDAPSREACSVRRDRTNTPMQALLLMNELQYLESARHLAQIAVDADCDNDRATAQLMFTRALGTPASDAALSVLLESLNAHRSEFSATPADAKQLISIGESPAVEKYNAVELASWTMVASLIMNMDEFVTKN